MAPLLDELTELNAIRDDQLRLMFSCCHPNLSEEAQVALMLHFLGGFSVKEVAQAYLSALPAVEKLIARAKKALAGAGVLFDVSRHADFQERLPSIHLALYLLFNQGYHGGSSGTPVQPVLCREAIRLVTLLLDHPFGQGPETFALAALMHFHAARLPAKLGPSGELTQLSNQDRSLWDRELVLAGTELLARAATGEALTGYHVEALIAGLHTDAAGIEDTNWAMIVHLYDALQRLKPSPVVALNRAIAISQLEGPARGLEEIGRISDASRLNGYPFYWAARGELQALSADLEEAEENFKRALSVARNPTERQHLQARIDALGRPRPGTSPAEGRR